LKERGTKGRKIGVETSPSKESSGERGTEVMFKERVCNREGIEGQVDWDLAMSRYESGIGKSAIGVVALTGSGGGGVA
jgi:hypothetical protein